MMKYAKLYSKNRTPQSQPIPGSGQVPNSAGGYAWALDRWALLDRFLILGSEDGTYYVAERKLTQDHAENAIRLIKEDGERVIARVTQVSREGHAPKNDPAIFALALAASLGNDKTRAAALRAVPDVCRTGTHLFQFAAACDSLRGWGRGLRRAMGDWYNAQPAEALAYQLVKYAQREGWSHRDLLRLAHPVPASEAHRVLYKWVVDAELTGPSPMVEAVERAKSAPAEEAAALVRESRLPREALPSEWLTRPDVWEALLQDMPMTAMVRNLATMTRVGLLQPGSAATRTVIERLGDAERLRKARVHPVALLLAQRTYAGGRGLRGKGEWVPVPAIVDALDAAFYTAFQGVRPTGKRYLLGIDVSGSMGSPIAGTPLTACEGATAMALVTVATEESCLPMAFAHEFKPLPLSGRMRLNDALRYTRDVNFGGTDCALPMLYASRKRLEVDVFVVYTDNETWYGDVHPVHALREYRQKAGIAAKLIVVGMASNGFSIADPADGGMLDVVGFDAAVPDVMAQFVA